MQNAQINFEFIPLKWIYTMVQFHNFWLAEKKDAWYQNPMVYRDITGRSGNKVGRELDVFVKLTPFQENEILLGYSHFWPDEFAEKKASPQEANVFFIQWIYKYSWNIF